MKDAQILRERLNALMEEMQYMSARMNRLINETADDLKELDRHRRLVIEHELVNIYGQKIGLEGEGGPDD